MDRELNQVLDKLVIIQKEVGGNDLNNSSKNNKKGDIFHDIKQHIIEKLLKIREISEELNTSKKSKHPRETIQKQQMIREELKLLDNEWLALKECYETEAKKKKSKLSKEEMNIRFEVVQQYSMEITKIKDEVTSGYMKNSNKTSGSPKLLTPSHHSLLSPYGSSAISSGINNSGANGSIQEGTTFNNNNNTNVYIGPKRQQEDITEEQKEILVQINNNDKRFDAMVDDIGVGIQELGQLARGLNEEVKKQNVILEGLDERIDHANEHVENVNKKMKDTLKKVGRGADKFMMDIICLIILLGILAVVYNMFIKPKMKNTSNSSTITTNSTSI